MSDIFYPRNVSGDKYNEAILDFIPMLTYTVAHAHGDPMAVVFETKSTPRAKAVIKAKIPAQYYEHLDCFLWRYYMFYQVYKVLHLGAKSSLLPSGVGLLQRMLVMLDTVVEQLLLRCIALGEHLTPDCRVNWFDFYLTTEFVVGYHDPPTVEGWRRRPENRDLDLERIDPFQLGRFRLL